MISSQYIYDPWLDELYDAKVSYVLRDTYLARALRIFTILYSAHAMPGNKVHIVLAVFHCGFTPV